MLIHNLIRYRCRLFLMMMMILAPCSQAALTIVADLGGQSTAAYFDAINAQDNEPTTSSNTEATPPDLTEGACYRWKRRNCLPDLLTLVRCNCQEWERCS